ncbi:Lrp/AsnC family transcriptional regulator [Marivirga arenosa]|jgi:Lrp/AsnC family leucine-responsive transcriptional regulator|uniref:Lrp/AsnC family transcriptional regulator n=1 Tax=Marivirga arenosa TaxID=3059076 RepID=A0AA49JAV9_9BACT|nr:MULTISPECIES: Lrp/AsnC family transcriptional regulator [unclassified Marivirga]WKK80053.2 Lrp/AsnC family transcriptional regulator [Marivirga sp. BKB1-2]WKK84894.2 Lrp/AsnC family transcriptional regulator [Marivirga sp. ABR2-2]
MENNSTLRLDRTDIEILKLLQQNARMTNKELAAKLDLTITPIYERVKRLEKTKVIRQYVALIDADKTGKGLMALCMLRLEKHTKDKLAQFEDHISKIPEVTECYHLAGQYDYHLKILVKDMNAFQDFIVNKLSTNQNLTNIQSSFVMKKITDTTAIPL